MEEILIYDQAIQISLEPMNLQQQKQPIKAVWIDNVE